MKNTFNPKDYTKYQVTGSEFHGRRFRITTTNPHHAMGINLWHGSVWGIRKDNGKRQLLKRVVN